MIRILQRYPFFHARILVAPLLLCLAVSLSASAQYDQDDSTLLSNTLDSFSAPAIDTTIVSENDTASSESEEEEIAYFRPLSLHSYGRDSIWLRKVSGNDWKSMRKDKAFWYADYAFKEQQPREAKPPLSAHPLFQLILWLIIIGGFAACVIMYLSNSNAGLFRKSRTIAQAEAEEETEDIFSINFQKEIDKATAAADYRLAIRLLFLRQLKRLSERNIIQYTQDKTNLDYLLQLRPTTMYSDFFRLARNYEYSWYGQFDIDSEKFGLIRKDFENFDRKLN